MSVTSRPVPSGRLRGVYKKMPEGSKENTTGLHENRSCLADIGTERG